MTEDLEQIAMENKVVVRDLMKVYKRGIKEVIALRGMDFEVKRGEFLSINFATDLIANYKKANKTLERNS